jgi:hypothetical protein
MNREVRFRVPELSNSGGLLGTGQPERDHDRYPTSTAHASPDLGLAGLSIRDSTAQGTCWFTVIAMAPWSACGRGDA